MNGCRLVKHLHRQQHNNIFHNLVKNVHLNMYNQRYTQAKYICKMLSHRFFIHWKYGAVNFKMIYRTKLHFIFSVFVSSCYTFRFGCNSHTHTHTVCNEIIKMRMNSELRKNVIEVKGSFSQFATIPCKLDGVLNEAGIFFSIFLFSLSLRFCFFVLLSTPFDSVIHCLMSFRYFSTDRNTYWIEMINELTLLNWKLDTKHMRYRCNCWGKKISLFFPFIKLISFYL